MPSQEKTKRVGEGRTKMEGDIIIKMFSKRTEKWRSRDETSPSERRNRVIRPAHFLSPGNARPEKNIGLVNFF
jgi:hypothetical protein